MMKIMVLSVVLKFVVLNSCGYVGIGVGKIPGGK